MTETQVSFIGYNYGRLFYNGDSKSKCDSMKDMSDLEKIRQRPAMYVGSTSQFGIQQLLFEAIDNAVDQFLAEKVTRILVRVIGRTIHISDDGEGYPFDSMLRDGTPPGVKYLTHFHQTNSADDHTPHVHANGFGCGIFTLNALTQKLEISAVRGHRLFRQSYSRGVPLGSIQELDAGGSRGTTIEFELDEQIFGDQLVDTELLRTKLRRLSYLFPGLTVRFQEEDFESRNGLIDLIRCEMGFESPPVFSISARQDGTTITAAAVGDTDQETQIASFANAVPTLDGSSHVNGLKRALRRAKWKPAGAAISVIISNPSYAGPTRQVLNIPGLDKRVSDLLSIAIKQFRSDV